MKKTGFEFNENEIDEVLGEKWKNEEYAIEELFDEEIADKRKKLNLENKNRFEVKETKNNIYLKPENKNNNHDNSNTEKQNQAATLNKD